MGRAPMGFILVRLTGRSRLKESAHRHGSAGCGSLSCIQLVAVPERVAARPEVQMAIATPSQLVRLPLHLHRMTDRQTDRQTDNCR